MAAVEVVPKMAGPLVPSFEPIVAELDVVPLVAWAQSSAAWGAASSWAVPLVPSLDSPARASEAAEEADPSQNCGLEGMAS